MLKSKRENINKKDLIKRTQDKVGISNSFLENFIDDVIEIISSGINLSKSLKIKNLGSFKIIRKKARIGRNPKNNKSHNITERNVITFKASDSLIEKLNND